MSTLVTATVKSNTSSPPAFQNSSGTQIGTLCRAWVNFNSSSGTPTISAQFNVSSITDNGAGLYTVNFSNAMSDANYAVTAMADGIYNGTICSIGHGDSDNTGMASGSVRVEGRGGSGGGSAGDSTYYCVAVFR
jgi:hypothetical protein